MHVDGGVLSSRRILCAIDKMLAVTSALGLEGLLM